MHSDMVSATRRRARLLAITRARSPKNSQMHHQKDGRWRHWSRERRGPGSECARPTCEQRGGSRGRSVVVEAGRGGVHERTARRGSPARLGFAAVRLRFDQTIDRRSRRSRAAPRRRRHLLSPRRRGLQGDAASRATITDDRGYDLSASRRPWNPRPGERQQDVRELQVSGCLRGSSVPTGHWHSVHLL
jgi:hypothetical protein